MSLQNLPTELILLIQEAADNQRDLLALSQTARRLHDILQPILLPYNVQHNRSSGLIWAAMRNNLPLAKEFLDAGADPNTRAMIPTELQDVFRVGDVNAFNRIEGSGVLEAPLWHAVSNGFEEMASLLLDRGACPHTTGWRNCPTVLSVADDKGFWSIAAGLVGRKAEFGLPECRCRLHECKAG